VVLLTPPRRETERASVEQPAHLGKDFLSRYELRGTGVDFGHAAPNLFFSSRIHFWIGLVHGRQQFLSKPHTLRR
jgi:hypothetical protein